MSEAWALPRGFEAGVWRRGRLPLLRDSFSEQLAQCWSHKASAMWREHPKPGLPLALLGMAEQGGPGFSERASPMCLILGGGRGFLFMELSGGGRAVCVLALPRLPPRTCVLLSHILLRPRSSWLPCHPASRAG